MTKTRFKEYHRHFIGPLPFNWQYVYRQELFKLGLNPHTEAMWVWNIKIFVSG